MGTFGDMTGIRQPKDLLDPLARNRDLIGTLAGGKGGSMNTSGRGQYEEPVNQYGDPWDYSGETEGQITPEQHKKNMREQAAKDRAQVRHDQLMNVGRLQRAAQGNGGPSVAQDQLQLASDKNMRGAMAMAASGRGNAALAGQAAGNQRAMMGQQLASQSGILRAQEMQSARQELAAAMSGVRQSDAVDANRELGYDTLEANKQIAEDNRIVQQELARSQRKSSEQAGWMGAAMTAAQLIAISSDERTKKNKQEVSDSDVSEFYKALEPKSYEYKDQHAAGSSPGQKVGMMSQDVEGTELGDKLFSRRADGISQYDPQVLDGILLAGMKKLMKDKNYGDS